MRNRAALAPLAISLAYCAFAPPETRDWMLNVYAALIVLSLGWYIIAKHRHLRWLADAPTRATAHEARKVALRERENVRRIELLGATRP